MSHTRFAALVNSVVEYHWATQAASNNTGGKRGASHSWDAKAHGKDKEKQGKCRASPQNHTYLHSLLLPRSLKARKMCRRNYCRFPPRTDEISRLCHSLNTVQGLYLMLLHILCQEEGKTENATLHPHAQKKNPQTLIEYINPLSGLDTLCWLILCSTLVTGGPNYSHSQMVNKTKWGVP